LQDAYDGKLDGAMEAMNRRCDQVAATAGRNVAALSDRLEQELKDVAASAADSIARVNDAQASLKSHTDGALQRIAQDVTRVREAANAASDTADAADGTAKRAATLADEHAHVLAKLQRTVAELQRHAADTPPAVAPRAARHHSSDEDDDSDEGTGASGRASKRYVDDAIETRMAELYDRLAPKAKAAAADAANANRRLQSMEARVASVEAAVDVPATDDEGAGSVVEHVAMAIAAAETRLHTAISRAVKQHEPRLRETDSVVERVRSDVDELRVALDATAVANKQTEASNASLNEAIDAVRTTVAELQTQQRDVADTVAELKARPVPTADERPASRGSAIGTTNTASDPEVHRAIERLQTAVDSIETDVAVHRVNIETLTQETAKLAKGPTTAANLPEDFEQWRNGVDADLDQLLTRVNGLQQLQQLTDGRLAEDRDTLREHHDGIETLHDGLERVVRDLAAAEEQLAVAIQGLAEGMVGHVVANAQPLPSSDVDPDTGALLPVDVEPLCGAKELELPDVTGPLWSAVAGQAVSTAAIEGELAAVAERYTRAVVELRQVVSAIAEVQGGGVHVPWRESSVRGEDDSPSGGGFATTTTGTTSATRSSGPRAPSSGADAGGGVDRERLRDDTTPTSEVDFDSGAEDEF